MEIEKDKIFAVLTGDIVGSSKLETSERKTLHDVLESTSKEIVLQFQGDVPYQPYLFRGDSWQFVVAKSSFTLRIGLYFRTYLKSRMESKRIDTRISMGIGFISFIPPNNLSSGDGEAFRLSGIGLENMDKSSRMTISFPDRFESDIASSIQMIVKLIDLQVKNWTERQSKVVSGALLGYTQKTIAEKLFGNKISQQAVAQHLDRAGWNSIESGINFFEKKLNKIANSNSH